MNIKKLTIPSGVEGKYLDFVTNEKFSEVYWLGGFGGGKTDGLVTSIYNDALNYPGATLVLVRDELTNLRRTTLPDLLAKAPDLIENHNKSDSVITFPPVPDVDGTPRSSVLYCFGMMTGDYEQKLKSLQPFRFYGDEIDKLQPEMIDMALLRCRQKVRHRSSGELGRNLLKGVANDMGNNWLWARAVGKPHPGKAMSPEWVEENVGVREEVFIPQYPRDVYPGDIVVVQQTGSRHVVLDIPDEEGRVRVSGRKDRVHWRFLKIIMQRLCIYSFTHENKSLSVQSLKNSRMVSQAMRDKYILGKIDTKTGLLFPEFLPHMHILPEMESSLYTDWPVIVGIDHGYEHPTAAVFVAKTPDGDYVVFDEYEASGLSSMENAEAILEVAGPLQKVRFVGDTMMWNVDPRQPGQSVATDYMHAGVKPLLRANRNREHSIDRIKDWMRPRSTFSSPEPRPKLLITSNCRRLIHSLSRITWEQFQAKRDDDLLDALRYAVMSAHQPSSSVNPEDLKPKPFSFRPF